MTDPAPELSVIIYSPTAFATLRRTVQALAAQTARDRMEFILATPSRAHLVVAESELAPFRWHQIVEVGAVGSLGQAKAVAIRQAHAPVVALGEDHVYPDPGWAAALIEAHRGPWAAVGSAVGNANPQSMIGWTNLLFGYGRWIDPVVAGVKDDIPAHNTAYKRDLLLEYGDGLGALLNREGGLHRDLRARGYQLYLEAAAIIYHLNVARLGPALELRYQAGRLFGATRAASGHWSRWRRLLYILGAPLIPLVHLRRLHLYAQRSGRQRQLVPRIFPALLTLLMAAAVGEAVGYAAGAGDALKRTESFEFGRETRHV